MKRSTKQRDGGEKKKKKRRKMEIFDMAAHRQNKSRAAKCFKMPPAAEWRAAVIYYSELHF